MSRQSDELYVCAARFLAPYVTSLGYAFLAFNRRGHDSVSTYDSREPVGGAYQTVAEGIEDNELAAQFLAEQGFKSPIVIGHSNGGVLASEHVARHPETRALILLSAHAGGNRLTNPNSPAVSQSMRKPMTQSRKRKVARRWQTAPADAHSGLVVGDLGTDIHGSTDQRTDLVENAKRIRCPVLFIRGDQEPVDNYPAEKFRRELHRSL